MASEINKNKETNGVFIQNRHMSIAVASGFLLLFFAFATGYFWGKKTAGEQFVADMQAQSFADQLYTTLCDNAIDDQECDVANAAPLVTEEQLTVSDENAQETSPKQTLIPTDQVPTEQINAPQYYAQLIGFGSALAAEKFQKKLAAHGIEVIIVKRESKTAKKKIITWYQAVTPSFSNKQKLEELVAQIKKQERLGDIKILES